MASGALQLIQEWIHAEEDAGQIDGPDAAILVVESVSVFIASMIARRTIPQMSQESVAGAARALGEIARRSAEMGMQTTLLACDLTGSVN